MSHRPTRVARKNGRAERTEEEGRRGRYGPEVADVGSLKINIGEALPIPVCGWLSTRTAWCRPLAKVVLVLELRARNPTSTVWTVQEK